MTDETSRRRTRRPRPSSPGGTSDQGSRVPGDDPDDALRRLESMGAPDPEAQPAAPSEPAAAREPAGPTSVPPTPAVDAFSGSPPRQARPTSGTRRVPRARPASGSRSSRMIARVAAPVVFLVAVIALLGIIVNSGVLGGGDDPTPGPTTTATQSGGGAQVKTKKYVVHEGDSLSSIAERFSTTTSQLMELNPDLNGTTVVVGQRIVVPAAD